MMRKMSWDEDTLKILFPTQQFVAQLKRKQLKVKHFSLEYWSTTLV